MAPREEPGVWPLWGRVLLAVGFAAVLVVAAVLALSGREDGLGAGARVVLSVGIAGLALLGVNLLAARLTVRSTQRFAVSLDDLERSAGTDRGVADAARRARAELDAGDVEAARAVVEELAADHHGVLSGPAAAAAGRSRRTARSAARMHRRQQRAAR